jgi:hypothetical protein
MPFTGENSTNVILGFNIPLSPYAYAVVRCGREFAAESTNERPTIVDSLLSAVSAPPCYSGVEELPSEYVAATFALTKLKLSWNNQVSAVGKILLHFPPQCLYTFSKLEATLAAPFAIVSGTAEGYLVIKGSNITCARTLQATWSGDIAPAAGFEALETELVG